MPTPVPDPLPESHVPSGRAPLASARGTRGRLRIFFGALPDIGQRAAMLQAARAQQAGGIDVVVGCIERRGRADLEPLLVGLECLPPPSPNRDGTAPAAFDLDAALARAPQLIVVEDLAQRNAPGARHPQRWMDVEALTAAGIDVYTTLDAQHVESLSREVAQIAGVDEHQTVPDRVFDGADDVDLIDLPPDATRQAAADDAATQPEHARRRPGDLVALRQLALRAVADRVDRALNAYRNAHAMPQTRPAGERVLVCVGPDPLSARLVRSARRLADALHAPWLAAYVETPRLQRLSREARDRVLQTLKLAESLGAETANLSGESVAAELLAYARARNVTKIIVGKPARARWRDRLRPSLVDEVVRGSSGIDVHVISGEPGADSPAPPRLPQRTSRLPAYAAALGVVALTTLVCLALATLVERSNLVMLYLLATLFVAMRFGRGPSALAACVGVALFDVLFVPPYYSFAVSDAQYLITFAVMLLSALVISNLAARGKRQSYVSRQRERRSGELYALSRELAQGLTLEALAAVLCRHALLALDGEAAVLLPDAHGHIQDPGHFCAHGKATAPVRYPVPGNDLGIAQWAFDHRQKAGRNSDTLASADAIYLPLNALARCIGVFALRPKEPRQLDIPEQMHLLEALVTQTAVAMERVQLTQASQLADTRVESERLRNVLLASISHDFRTPLASIIGASSTLLDAASDSLAPAQRRALLQSLNAEALRLHRLVGNLLDLTRLTSGPVQVKRDWVALDEVVGAVLNRLHDTLASRTVTLDMPQDLPLVRGDEVMLEQVLFNLIENACKHTPAGSALGIALRAFPASVEVRVADSGPGLPVGEEQRVFDKFHRGRPEAAQSGFGLGLTICKAIVEAHGGEIQARNRAEGGAEFRFSLPREPEPAA